MLYTSDSAWSLPIVVRAVPRAAGAAPATVRTGAYTFDPSIGPSRYLIFPVDSAGPEVAAVLVAAPSATTLLKPRPCSRACW